MAIEHRVDYVDRDPEFFARLAPGGFRSGMCRLHLVHVSVMKKPVERGARQQEVTEQGWPFLDRAIRREDRRATLVALADDLVEIDRLVSDQRP